MSNVRVNNEKPYDCSFNGVAITPSELCELHQFYEASCTAEYLNENYGIEPDDAMTLGYIVRQRMDKYDFNEETAIDEVLREHGRS